MAEEAPGPAEETAPEEPQQQKQRGVVKVSRCAGPPPLYDPAGHRLAHQPMHANAGRSGSTAIKASAF